MANGKTLLITGITGFLGGHMALEALRRGYHVRGTLRSMDRADHVRSILKANLEKEAPDAIDRLSFHEADLLDPRGWEDAASGCDAVLHVASPFPLALPKHEDDLIQPARQGVRNVFNAAVNQGVHRFVQTSSSVAIMYGHGRQRDLFDEKDWTRLDGPMISPYIKSKTLAEKDLWALAEAHPIMNVSAVNPGFILGPVLDPKDPGSSCDVVLKMMRGEYPGVPKLGYPTVDVRDVVALHFHVLEDAEAKGERYAAIAETIPFKDLAKAIKQALPDKARKVSALQLPSWFFRVFALFESSVKTVVPELGYMPTVLSEKGRNRYPWKPRSAADAAVATAQSLVELGYIP